MKPIDTEFCLVATNGDRLYPYKKKQLSTGRYGYALSAPGEQDRNGQGTYTDDIALVIRRVVFDGWGVRAKLLDKSSSKREGTYVIGKRSIVAYEISKDLAHLVKGAPFKPYS